MDWPAVGAAAAQEAGGIDAALLGDFLPTLAGAASTGTRLGRHQLAAFRALGARAADEGAPLPALVDLFLSAAWRAWRLLPAVDSADPEAVRAAGDAVLHAVDDTVAAVVAGYQAARRTAATVAEAARREFVDDLLGGTGDPVGMLERAERLGLHLTGPQQVAVVRGRRAYQDNGLPVSRATAAVAATGVADFLVTTRHGLMVAVLPGGVAADTAAALAALETSVARGDATRIAVGRVHQGVAGVARSYRDAGETLDLADRLDLGRRLVRADELLVYRVLLRDREAIVDLIETVLAPLHQARGGAGPLLDTVEAYLATGANSTATARRMHLSVRAVTYRLARVKALTGHDPAQPQDRFVLHAALLGARALGWPQTVAGARQD